ncbi:hypothetical protein D9M68_748570 [compost metagenome]
MVQLVWAEKSKGTHNEGLLVDAEGNPGLLPRNRETRCAQQWNDGEPIRVSGAIPLLRKAQRIGGVNDHSISPLEYRQICRILPDRVRYIVRQIEFRQCRIAMAVV